MGKEVHIRLKGSFYSFNTHCKSVAEWLRQHKDYKRSMIAEHWKENN